MTIAENGFLCSGFQGADLRTSPPAACTILRQSGRINPNPKTFPSVMLCVDFSFLVFVRFQQPCHQAIDCKSINHRSANKLEHFTPPYPTVLDIAVSALDSLDYLKRKARWVIPQQADLMLLMAMFSAATAGVFARKNLPTMMEVQSTSRPYRYPKPRSAFCFS